MRYMYSYRFSIFLFVQTYRDFMTFSIRIRYFISSTISSYGSLLSGAGMSLPYITCLTSENDSNHEPETNQDQENNEPETNQEQGNIQEQENNQS